VQADLGLQLAIRPDWPDSFPCYAHILDAPLHSLVVLPPQRCAWCGVLRFAARSLPTAFLYGVLEFHTSCRAARCDHECVSYGRTYSSNDRSRASRIACCGVLRFAGEFAPDFHQHSRALGPSYLEIHEAYRAARHGSRFLRTRRTSSERTLLAPHKRRRYSCFRLLQGEFAPKNSVTSPSIFRSAMPTEPRGMVQDSPIPDTPMLERTLLAPKKTDVRSSVLVSVGCTYRPRLSILAASSCTPPAEPLGTVQMRLV
jgi:hypothetical protein